MFSALDKRVKPARQPIGDYKSYKASIAAWHAAQAAASQGSPAQVPHTASTKSPDDTPPANGAAKLDPPAITEQVVKQQPSRQRPHVDPKGEQEPRRDDPGTRGPPGGCRGTSRPRKDRQQPPKDPLNLPTSSVAGTALFRPVDSAHGCFVGVKRADIAAELSGTPGALAVRVNARRNVVAVDASTADGLSTLLATTTLCGIAVRARPAADKSRSSGAVHDVELTIEKILEGLESPVPVESVRRGVDEGTFYLRFAAPEPPDFVSIFKIRLPVRAHRPRPLQCGRCGRFNHATASCGSDPRCPRCGEPDHDRSGCGAPTPRCSNCEGPHEVADPWCPRWQLERRVVTEIARSPHRVSRAFVSANVRAQEQARLPDPPAAPAPGSSNLADVRGCLMTALLNVARAISEVLPEGSPEQQMIAETLAALPSG